MPYLDPVVQEFVAMAEKYIGPVNDMAAAAAAAKAANDLLVQSVGELNDKMPALVFGMSAANDQITSMNLRSGNAAKTIVGALVPALVALDVELDKKIAALTKTAGGMSLLAAASRLSTAATMTNVRANGLWIGGLRLTANALHWIIAGAAEILAVVIPAMIAAAAWATVWAEGVTQVAQHMNALGTATSAAGDMFNTSAGQILGLSDALGKASDAAKPQVYQALGAALQVVKERSGGLAQVGLQIGKIFDTFMARVVQDFSKTGSLGSSLDSILSHMTKDLVGLGQVFGNLGHAILVFAGQMPGLAEVLLGVLDGLTRLVVIVLDFANALGKLGFPILTIIMAFEEFNRWGGLLVGLLTRMGLASGTLATGMFSAARAVGIVRALFMVIPGIIGNVGIAIGLIGSSLGRLGTGIQSAGAGIVGFAARISAAIGALSGFQILIIAVAAAALGFLIYKLLTAKDATTQFTGALQTMVDKSSNVKLIGALSLALGEVNAKLAQNQVEITKTSAALRNYQGPYAGAARAVYALKAANEELSASQRSLQAQFITTAAHATFLADKYRTSLLGAMVLADQAGVKLNHTTQRQAWAFAQLKIANLVQGYKAMGAPLTAVGADMTALGIQAGVTGSKVSQLNQAWDQFMQEVTGGTTGLASFQTSLQNIAQGVANVSQNLGQGSGSAAASARQFGQALATFGKAGAQAWQNLGQVVGQTAPQLVDWLRTAGAMGAISGSQFTLAVRSMVGELLKYVGTNKAAVTQLSDLAHMAGGPTTSNIKTLAKWVGNTKNAAATLSKIVQDATTKMGDMAAVAQQLGTVLQNDIVNIMGKAVIAQSGLTRATDAYIQALKKGSASAQQGGASYNKLVGVLRTLGYTAKQAQQLVQLLSNQINNLHSKTITIGVLYQSYGYNPLAGISKGAAGTSTGGAAPATPFRAFVPGGGLTIINQHVHGSVLTEQQVTRSLQGSFNRKTFRNGSTQIYLPGRAH